MPLINESDRKKLEHIYEKYKNCMFVVAYRVLGDAYEAEDVLHDSIVAVSRNLDKIGDVDSLSTASYVIKAAKNTALNRKKRSFNEIPAEISEEEIVSDENTLERLCTQENYQIVVNAILSLDEKYRDVLSLYYFNELSVSQIADLLSRKENTVKQQLARGRQKLIRIIEKETDIYGKQ